MLRLDWGTSFIQYRKNQDEKNIPEKYYTYFDMWWGDYHSEIPA